ncbi:hypothetical protein FH972_022001 [Carpinus fangiana]|uniref:Uncharacterized protein n=1 Tax=Carpinus fangiana TaxID=176857 RepID=A0A5N6KQZ0_9ROSI|nr:hypothetical protein FH972_022001 [Carpinus fangiana]
MQIMASSSKLEETQSSVSGEHVGLYSPPRLQEFFDNPPTIDASVRRSKFDGTELWMSVFSERCADTVRLLKAGLPVNGCRWYRHVSRSAGRLEDGCRAIIDVAATSRNATLLRTVLQSEPDLTGSAAAAHAEATRREIVHRFLPEEQKKLKLDMWSTPLHLTAAYGHTEALTILIDEGHADVNVRNPRSRTPLHCAILGGSVPAVRILLDRGAAVDMVDMDGISPLASCAHRGNVEMVNLCLFYAAPVNAQDQFGNTPLLNASATGNHDIVRLLLRSHAEIEIRNEAGFTAFFEAAARFDTTIMDTLTLNGADPDAADLHGCTPLIRAALADNVPLVKHLLRCGASLDATDADGWTALTASLVAGADDVTLLLLLNGADTVLPDYMGDLPLHAAARHNSVFCVRYCLQHAASVDATSGGAYGAPALTIAAAQGHIAVVRLLLRAGAAVDATNEDSHSPLDHAVYWGQHACAALLINHGVSISDVTLQALAQGKRDRPEAQDAYDALAAMLRRAGHVIPAADIESNFADLFARGPDAVALMRVKQGKAIDVPGVQEVPGYAASTKSSVEGVQAWATSVDPFEASKTVGGEATGRLPQARMELQLRESPQRNGGPTRASMQELWGSKNGKTRK